MAIKTRALVGLHLLLISILVFSNSDQAFAFRLSPMEADFATQGAEIAKTFTVENNTREKIAVEFTLFKREMDIDGNETRIPTDRFTVYPEQAQLEPGEKRSVRVTWTGPAELTEEEAYRLIADQLPVQLKAPKVVKGSEVNLKFVMQYVASLYVSSGPVRPKVRIESARITASKSGKPEVEISLVNEGNAHQVLAGSRLLLRPKDAKQSKAIEISRDQVKMLDAENILAGGRRRFIFEAPKDLVNERVKDFVGKQVDAEIEIHSK